MKKLIPLFSILLIFIFHFATSYAQVDQYKVEGEKHLTNIRMLTDGGENAVHPDLAVAIDVTHAKGPGTDGWQAMVLGKGPGLGWGANLHPFLYKKFDALAKKLEIPAALDPMPQHSGTDAYAIQVAGEGIPCMLLSIPLRYMHTPVEVIAIKDVQRTGRLLAEFIAGLGPDFLSTITWEDEEAGK